MNKKWVLVPVLIVAVLGVVRQYLKKQEHMEIAKNMGSYSPENMMASAEYDIELLSSNLDSDTLLAIAVTNVKKELPIIDRVTGVFVKDCRIEDQKMVYEMEVPEEMKVLEESVFLNNLEDVERLQLNNSMVRLLLKRGISVKFLYIDKNGESLYERMLSMKDSQNQDSLISK